MALKTVESFIMIRGVSQELDYVWVNVIDLYFLSLGGVRFEQRDLKDPYRLLQILK